MRRVTNAINRWVISGLTPKYNHYSSEEPINCDNSSENVANSHRLRQEWPILRVSSYYGPDEEQELASQIIAAGQNYIGEEHMQEFWKNQWKKYGSCGLYTDVNEYMTDALKLRYNYKIEDFLENAKIQWNTEYEISFFSEKLFHYYKKRVTIWCFSDETNKIKQYNFIRGIIFCFEKTNNTFVITDCLMQTKFCDCTSRLFYPYLELYDARRGNSILNDTFMWEMYLLLTRHNRII